MKTIEHENVIDLTDYPHVEDLILISDVLVTDYSSIAFDFERTGKPIVIYTPDSRGYEEERGTYQHVIEKFDRGRVNDLDEVIEAINWSRPSRNGLKHLVEATRETAELVTLILNIFSKVTD